MKGQNLLDLGTDYCTGCVSFWVSCNLVLRVGLMRLVPQRLCSVVELPVALVPSLQDLLLFSPHSHAESLCPSRSLFVPLQTQSIWRLQSHLSCFISVSTCRCRGESAQAAGFQFPARRPGAEPQGLWDLGTTNPQ